MSFNIRSGFTLVEVMIATGVMAIMCVSIFALQTSVTRSVLWITKRFEHMLHARNFLIESSEKATDSEKDVITLSKKIDRPSLDLQYEKSKVTSEEPFGKVTHSLYKQQVTLSWQESNKKKQQDVFVSYFYQPKKTKKSADGRQNPSAIPSAPPVHSSEGYP